VCMDGPLSASYFGGEPFDPKICLID
jgi:hypothetical protein